MSTNDRLQQTWGKLVARSWEDAALRTRLETDPAAVLKENGVELPQGMRVQVLKDDGHTLYLPLTPKPDSTEVTEQELDMVAGGLISAQISATTVYRSLKPITKSVDIIHGPPTVV